MNILSNMGSHQTCFQGKQAVPPTFNITFVGNEGCGKSTIIRRYIMNQFVETTHTKNNEQLTELTPHIVNLSGSQKVGVVFWEIAINPHSLIKREQYSRSDAIIVVVSSVDDATITQWRQEIADMVGEDVPVLVLFNSLNDSPEQDYHDDVPNQKEIEACFHTRDKSMYTVPPHTEDDSVHEVHPQTGDGSVHKAINQLLWKLVENSQTKPYPVSYLTATQSHTDHMHQ